MKDSTGRYLTKALFVEFNDGSFTPKFALKEQNETKDIPWLRRLYIESEDVTEARFAEQVFGNQEHWRKLCSAQWFGEYIDEWRKDLEGILSARGVDLMKTHAANSPVAAKWLAEKGWKGKPQGPNGRGRPTKEEVQGERKRQAEDRSFYTDAAARMFKDD